MTIAPETFGLIDSLLEVSDAQMIEFSAKVQMLDSDVLISMSKLPPIGELDAVQQAFVIWQSGTWTPWLASWNVWAAEHQTGLSRMPFSAAVEFGKFNSEFNLQLRAFKEFGGTTTLTPTETTAPEEPVNPPEDEPWYETVTDSIMQHMLLTTLIGGAGLLAYMHVTKKI